MFFQTVQGDGRLEHQCMDRMQMHKGHGNVAFVRSSSHVQGTSTSLSKCFFLSPPLLLKNQSFSP